MDTIRVSIKYPSSMGQLFFNNSYSKPHQRIIKKYGFQ